MSKLFLKECNPKNYVVVELNDGTSFVHDNINGQNYFSQKAIQKISGLTQKSVSKHIKRFKDHMNNTTNSSINLEIFNSKKPVEFYSFDVVTFICFRSNKKEAIQMRQYIQEAINEKFNADTGLAKKPLAIEEKFKRENNALVKQIMHKQVEISNLELKYAKLKKLYYREELSRLEEEFKDV